MPNDALICPRNGQPIDMKYISKWSETKFLAFCTCGYVHELEPAKPSNVIELPKIRVEHMDGSVTIR